MEELRRASKEQPEKSGGKDGNEDSHTLNLTPSQRLCKAASAYRDAYGPSMPMPSALEKLCEPAEGLHTAPLQELNEPKNKNLDG